MMPGDVHNFAFTIEYDVNNIPFFAQEFVVEFIVGKNNGHDKTTQKVRVTGKVYFTAYNTVEIMSEIDYAEMYRTWHGPESNIPTTRIYIPKDQIPVSDLDITRDTVGGVDMDSIEIRYVRINGLAYDIPMKVYRSQIPPGFEDDGPDSLVFRTAGGGADARRRRFTGVVTGRVTSVITNDVGMVRVIGLSGIHIKLKERDVFFDEDFGEMHTDDNGFFTFRYDEMQSGTEGSNIELYLVIQSKNQDQDIKAKRAAILGSSFDQTLNLGSFGTNGGNITGNITTDIRAMRVVNWAVRAWEYCEGVGGHALHNDLSILPNANGSSFSGDGIFGISAPFTKPTIRLRPQDCDQEGTLYHEFGHFIMWNIQNRNYIFVPQDPLQNGDHFWSRENTPQLAWSEGFAAATSMIMDAAHWWEDQEYGFDDAFGIFAGPLYEDRLAWPDINNGIWAEYYVGCAIYDLWDGDPAIPDVIQTMWGPWRVGQDDINTWATDDNVRWDYMWILLPISWNGGSSGKLQNIEEYFYWFRDHVVGAVDCQARADVARVFRENRVMQDIADFQTNPAGNATALSGDDLRIDVTLAYLATGIPPIRSVTHKINPPNNYFQTASRVMDLNFGFNSNQINENLFVTGAPGVPNSRIRLNPSVANGNFITCNNPQLTFTFANFEMGSATTRATLQLNGLSLWQFNNGSQFLVNHNSVMTVGAGSTLHIRTGSTVNLGTNAQVIVQAGGFICIEAGVTITQAAGSGFILQPGAILGVNPALGIIAGVCNPPPPPVPGAVNEALQFDGVNDYVDIANNSGGLNVGAGNFTIEAYVRLNNTGGMQIIASNRTWVAGGTADGFMLAVWGNGEPFMQLAGTPNIDPVGQPNIMDGNCHHLAVVRNGITLSFYIDGQFVGNGVATSGSNINSVGTLRLGSDRITTNSPLNGWIGEVRFWNVARTPAQIAASVNANLVPPQAGLVSYFDMRDPTGQVLGDISGNGILNNGTLGSTAGADVNDPVWLTPAQVTCNVGGNFRMITKYPVETGQDTAGIAKSIDVAKAPVDKPYLNSNVVIQPNPTRTTFSLLLPARYRNVQIEVVNSAGAVVERRRVRQNETNLRFGQTLQPGFYVLRVISDEGTETFKLVKQ